MGEQLAQRVLQAANHYQTLGAGGADISPTSTSNDLRKAYLQLSVRIHPDKLAACAFANEAFQKLVHAYDSLRLSSGRNHLGDPSMKSPRRSKKEQSQPWTSSKSPAGKETPQKNEPPARAKKPRTPIKNHAPRQKQHPSPDGAPRRRQPLRAESEDDELDINPTPRKPRPTKAPRRQTTRRSSTQRRSKRSALEDASPVRDKKRRLPTHEGKGGRKRPPPSDDDWQPKDDSTNSEEDLEEQPAPKKRRPPSAPRSRAYSRPPPQQVERQRPQHEETGAQEENGGGPPRRKPRKPIPGTRKRTFVRRRPEADRNFVPFSDSGGSPLAPNSRAAKAKPNRDRSKAARKAARTRRRNLLKAERAALRDIAKLQKRKAKLEEQLHRLKQQVPTSSMGDTRQQARQQRAAAQAVDYSEDRIHREKMLAQELEEVTKELAERQLLVPTKPSRTSKRAAGSPRKKAPTRAPKPPPEIDADVVDLLDESTAGSSSDEGRGRDAVSTDTNDSSEESSASSSEV